MTVQADREALRYGRCTQCGHHKPGLIRDLDAQKAPAADLRARLSERGNGKTALLNAAGESNWPRIALARRRASAGNPEAPRRVRNAIRRPWCVIEWRAATCWKQPRLVYRWAKRHGSGHAVKGPHPEATGLIRS